MNLIKTKSFELAIITKGNENATRMVIALPGRLDTKDYACFSSHLEYFANKGFFAVSFDPPGTWDSSGGIELFTTSNYIKAVIELIEYYGNRPTFLLGHSRGGQVAMLVGTANPAVIGFALINSSYDPPTPPNPKEILGDHVIAYRDLPPGDCKTSKQKKFVFPLSYFKDGEQYDPKPALKLCTKPKILFYGLEDKYYTAEDINEIYNDIPYPKMIKELNVKHDYRYSPKIIKEINEALGEFIDKYLNK